MSVQKLTQEEVFHLITLRATKIANIASGAKTCEPALLREYCKTIVEETNRILELQAQLAGGK